LLLVTPALSLGQERQNAGGPDKGGLTGVWRGTYHYPQDGQKPVNFEMVLIQNGGTVVGFMKEPNTFGERQEPFLHAAFKGKYDEQTRKLTVVKTYDGTAGPKHDVEYAGDVAQAGNKIEGKWDIGGLSGDFTLERVANTRGGGLAAVWTGSYSYPKDAQKDDVKFQMLLVQEGKKVIGFTKEPNTFGKNNDEPWLHADLKGQIDERTGILTITKTYDGTAGETHSVEYSATPSQDRSKLEGTWALPELPSGRFRLEKRPLDDKTLEELK